MVIAHRPPQTVPAPLSVWAEQAQTGDAAAFTQLMQEYERPVFNLLLSQVRNPQDAEDVAQEVWLKVARHLNRLRDPDRFAPWLFRIARNCSIDFIQSRQCRPQTTASDDDVFDLPAVEHGEPEYQLLSLDERRKVWETLGAMSERDRTALFLREFQELPYADIGEALQISRGAAEVLMFRARQRFRDRFAKSEAAAPASCNVIPPLQLSAMIDGELSGPARLELEGHLRGCTTCADWLQTMETGRELFRGFGLIAVPVAVSAAVHAKIAALFGGSAGAAGTALAAGGSGGAATGAALGAGAAAGVSSGTGAGLTGTILTSVAGKILAATLTVGAVATAVEHGIVPLPLPHAIMETAVKEAIPPNTAGEVVAAATLSARAAPAGPAPVASSVVEKSSPADHADKRAAAPRDDGHPAQDQRPARSTVGSLPHQPATGETGATVATTMALQRPVSGASGPSAVHQGDDAATAGSAETEPDWTPDASTGHGRGRGGGNPNGGSNSNSGGHGPSVAATGGNSSNGGGHGPSVAATGGSNSNSGGHGPSVAATGGSNSNSGGHGPSVAATGGNSSNGGGHGPSVVLGAEALTNR